MGDAGEDVTSNSIGCGEDYRLGVWALLVMIQWVMKTPTIKGPTSSKGGLFLPEVPTNFDPSFFYYICMDHQADELHYAIAYPPQVKESTFDLSTLGTLSLMSPAMIDLLLYGSGFPYSLT